MAIERWRPFVSIDKWEPLQGMSDVQEQWKRIFGTFVGAPTVSGASSAVRTWAPVFDMHETKDEVVLNFELPGVSDKDVSLSITGDLLTLKGERTANREFTDENAYRAERVYGKFERSVELPMPVQA